MAVQPSTRASRREQLRRIMNLAWDLFRAEEKGPDPRTFADALAGAWRFMKRIGQAPAPAWAKVQGQRHVSFGSMVASPIRRASHGPYAGVNAARSGYVTSSLGR